MKRNDWFLVVTLGVCAVLVAGIMQENLRPPGVKIDVAKVKTQLKKAGLDLHEAKYWRVLFYR